MQKMKNRTLKIALITAISCPVLYFSAFYILGWLAPNNDKINKFYSSKFYGLRQWKEAEYLNKEEVFEGELYFSTNNSPGVQLRKGHGIGFEVPSYLDERVSKIPSGSRVRIHVGKKLDDKSIGMYWNELREISKIQDINKHNKSSHTNP